MAVNVCGLHLHHPKQILTFGAVLSWSSHLTIFVLYYLLKIPSLQRHPTALTIHKTWFEFLFVAQFLFMFHIPESFYWKEYGADDNFECVPNPDIWPLSWLTQFSLLGGELWLAVLSMDIHVALTNPFTSYAANANKFKMWVYGLAITTATVLVCYDPIQYGLSNEPLIWIQVRDETFNLAKILCFFVFMFVIYTYSAFICVWARNQIYKGLEETLIARRYSVRKQTIYVFGYLLFWTCVFTLQFFIYLSDKDHAASFISKAEVTRLHSASAFLLASRGLWSLVFFVAANWNELSEYITARGNRTADQSTCPKEEEEQVHLNLALQKEIVRFTGLGIQKAVKDINDQLEAKAKMSRSQKRPSFLKDPIKKLDHFSFIVTDPDIMRLYQDSVNRMSENYRKSGRISNLEEIYAEHFANGGLVVVESPLIRSINSRPISQPKMDPEMENTVELVPQDITRYSMRKEEEEGKSQMPMSRSISFQRGLSDIRKFVRDNVEFFKLKVAPPRNNFLFTDYSPKLFRRIRELWGINKTDYIESFKSTTLPSFSEGRSGAFLYFSSDYKYIVKTTILSEFNKLLSILPDYVQYLSSELERGHKSLITRFYGAHRIVMYDIPIYFVVMENICPKVDEKYDLKGSWVNRHGSTLNKNLRPKTKLKGKTPLFLDNDLHNSIALRPDVAIKLAKQLVRDVTFLSERNLMDYSLLIGVRRRKYEIFDRKNNDSVRDSSSVVSSNGDDSVPNPYHQDEDGAIHAALVQAKGTFYIGIIDVLQEWNWNKWSERMTKVHVLRKEAAGLSAIEPDVYRKRFIQRAIIDVFEFVDELDIAKVLQEMNKEDCKDGSNDLDGACTSEGSNLSDDSYTRYFDKKGLTHNAECLAREEFKKDNSDDEKDVEMGENSSNELFATTIERPRHGNCANTIVGVDDRFNVSPLHNDYCGH